MQETLSPKQVATALGVSEASVKRWCDKGLLAVRKTPGGHRRLPIGTVVQFARRGGQVLACPEALGLALLKNRSPVSEHQIRKQLERLLAAGEEDQFRRLVANLYVKGYSVYELGDGLLAPLFADLGDRWCRHELEVYQERRAVEICTRVLHHLRAILPPIDNAAPVAMGSTLEGDPYTLANMMAEIALREAGWNATSCGAGNPAATLCNAIGATKPKLFWLSIASVTSERMLRSALEKIARATKAVGAVLALGGRLVPEEFRHTTPHMTYCGNLASLVALSATLR